MKIIVITILMILSSSSWSTVIIGASDCPTHFEGRVKEIIESHGPNDIFLMQKVVFENDRTLKGAAENRVLLDVLQNGPFTFELEKEYRVQLRNGKLCWMEEI